MTQLLDAGRTSPPPRAAGVPRLATGVDLIGAYQASGFKDPPCLVRRADGQTIQLTPLLYATLELIDGERDEGQIADGLSQRTGRGVSADNVRYLITEKLRPAGLLKDAQGRDPQVRKANPLLALRLRLEITSEKWTNRLAAPFTVLFKPWIVAPVLVGFAAVVVWVLGFKGLGVGARQLLYSPTLLLASFALMIASASFHELGHAAGCRYSGGRPGVMGCGLYLVWPAFYTDVTDAYRLDRAGRLRTDLGGLYFNAVFALATFGVWAATGADALLLLIPLQLLQMVHQLLPFVRLDGYHILSDLVGVPDLFARIKPTLLGLLPWRRASAQATALKPWVRAVVVLWVLAVVPLLLFSLAMAVIAAPRMIATAWDSAGLRWQEFSRSVGGGDWGAGLVNLLGIGAVILPVAGIIYVLSRFGRRATAYAWSSAGALRFGQPALATVGVVAAAAVAFSLWPNGEYRPLQPGERLAFADAVRAVKAAPTGRPGLTAERERELGGAPAKAWPLGEGTTAPAGPGAGGAPEPAPSTTTVAPSPTTAKPSATGPSTSLAPTTTAPTSTTTTPSTSVPPTTSTTI